MRDRRVATIVAGVVVCLAAILIGLAEDERIIGPSRSLHRVCWVVAILGGVVALAALGALLVDRARTGGSGRIVLASAFFLALAFAAFATYSLGFYWKETRSLCWEGSSASTIAERRRATEEGVRRSHSVFNVLSEPLFPVRPACDEAEEGLRQFERGECPYEPVSGLTCRCGNEVLPRDARCAHPQCAPLNPPRTRCPGDTW